MSRIDYFSCEHSSPFIGSCFCLFQICSVFSYFMTYCQTFNKSYMMDTSCGAGTPYTLLEHLSSSLIFTGVSVALVLCVVYCQPLFVFLSFFCWPLYCLVLWFMASDYNPFKLFLNHILKRFVKMRSVICLSWNNVKYCWRCCDQSW